MCGGGGRRGGGAVSRKKKNPPTPSPENTPVKGPVCMWKTQVRRGEARRDPFQNAVRLKVSTTSVSSSSSSSSPSSSPFLSGSVVLLNVLGCRLTYQGQAETNVEAWFNIALRPRKPEGSLGRTAQDGHLDSHTAPEL